MSVNPAGPAIGVDVGGSTLKGVILDAHGDRTCLRRRDTPDGPAAVVAAIREFCHELADERAGRAALGLGLAVPGLVDTEHGVARYSANLGWKDVPLARLVATDTGLPVRLDHDVRTAGLAEGALGAARGQPDYLFVSIGTGIAAAVCIGGAVLAGPSGAAGELGHVPVYPDGAACACGQRGCLEAYASAAAISRRYAALGGEPIDAAGVAELLEDDPRAAQVWAEATTALGIALATYTLIADPALIVLGGGLADAGALLSEPVHAELAARLVWRGTPALVMAELGADAGCVGAALLGRQAGGDA